MLRFIRLNEAKGAWFVVLLIAPLFLTGCIGVVAVPAFSNKLIAGRVLRDGDVSFIRPGVTSRSMVVTRLGASYRSHPRTSAIAYTWELPGGVGGDLSWSRWRALFIAFNHDGTVIHTQFVRLSERKTLDQQLEKWGTRVEEAHRKNRSIQGRTS